MSGPLMGTFPPILPATEGKYARAQARLSSPRCRGRSRWTDISGKRSGACAAHAEAAQDHLERTEVRERALQQVRADERGEPEPVGADEERTARHAEGERQEDE